MAFKTAAGYGNLPNGNFSPVIYSKQVQLAFRKNSIVEAITNSDYLLQKYGEKPYFITTIFVVVSFFKYRQYTLKKHNTIDPVKTLFKSKTLILSNVLWVLSIFILNNLW